MNRIVKRGYELLRLAALCALCVGGAARAQSPDAEARYQKLTHELRCLVCQNQTLAESGADLAEDLKKEVRALIAQGKSDEDIKAFLRARYGDFILYKPPVQANTLPLWLGPFAALALGGVVGLVLVRKRTAKADIAGRATAEPMGLSEAERRELEERLK